MDVRLTKNLNFIEVSYKLGYSIQHNNFFINYITYSNYTNIYDQWWALRSQIRKSANSQKRKLADQHFFCVLRFAEEGHTFCGLRFADQSFFCAFTWSANSQIAKFLLSYTVHCNSIADLLLVMGQLRNHFEDQTVWLSRICVCVCEFAFADCQKICVCIENLRLYWKFAFVLKICVCICEFTFAANKNFAIARKIRAQCFALADLRLREIFFAICVCGKRFFEFCVCGEFAANENRVCDFAFADQ